MKPFIKEILLYKKYMKFSRSFYDFIYKLQFSIKNSLLNNRDFVSDIKIRGIVCDHDINSKFYLQLGIVRISTIFSFKYISMNIK